VGGPFTFKYSEVTPELIRSDFRYGIVGEPFIEQHNDIEDLGNVEYTGPFYYYKKGLNSEAVVESEVEAIRRSDIVFLVFPEDGQAPGTVAELIFAATLNKRIEIFYVPTDEQTEEDVSSDNLATQIHHQYWYPFHQARIINPNITFHKCNSTEHAKDWCATLIKTIN
jgi:nucleoside 2-deoxyribosyltransferase